MRSFVWFLCAPFSLFLASVMPVFADTTTSSTEPIILQMRDGRFYHPSSGVIADSKTTLLYQLGYTTNTLEIAPVPTSTQALPSPAPLIPLLLQSAYDARAMLASEPVPDKKLPKNHVWVSAMYWNQDTHAFRRADVDVTTSVAWKHDGYVASWFSAKPREVLVAIRRPLVDRVKVKKVYTYPVRGAIISTPYAKTFQTAEIVAVGKQLLDGWVNDAYTTLNTKQIHSKAFPSRLVTEIIDPSIPKSIVAIEHLDKPSIAKLGEPALDPFYTRIALGQKEAYGTSISSAGAQGIAQFMKATYQVVQRRHPEANLPTSYAEAMKQTDVSILANILYLDDLLAELPTSARADFLNNPSLAGEYIVAAYNGGPARIARAIEYWDRVTSGSVEQLNVAIAEGKKLQKQLTKAKKALASASAKTKPAKKSAVDVLLKKIATNKAEQDRLSKTRLRKETVVYLQKYRLVHDFMNRTSTSSL